MWPGQAQVDRGRDGPRVHRSEGSGLLGEGDGARAPGGSRATRDVASGLRLWKQWLPGQLGADQAGQSGVFTRRQVWETGVVSPGRRHGGDPMKGALWVLYGLCQDSMALGARPAQGCVLGGPPEEMPWQPPGGHS